MNRETPRREAFAALFAKDDDPWRFRTRFYEARKRALTLACLPDARYHRGYEPGCANGELTAALATRCDRLTASDGVRAAVEQARARVAGLAHVEVFEGWVPDAWPTGPFDLIVVSELAYFLTEDELRQLIASARQSLAGAGTFVACHWRHPIDGFTLDATAAHAQLDAHLGMHRMVHHQEPDLLLDVWCSDARSIAERD